jgi:hypothetical protein
MLSELRPPFRIDDARVSYRAWLLSLAGEWTSCRVQRTGEDQGFALTMPLWIEDAMVGIHAGMSGLRLSRRRGGSVVSVRGRKEGSTQGGPNPRLADCVPGWLL